MKLGLPPHAKNPPLGGGIPPLPLPPQGPKGLFGSSCVDTLHTLDVTTSLIHPSHGGTYVVEGRLSLGSDWLIVVHEPCHLLTFIHRRAL